MIPGFDESRFRQVLGSYLTPARAIRSPEHLKGRSKALAQIDRALASPGKHVFVHGDRGVGKTSLALTAAFLHQSSDADPLFVACGGARFLETVRDALRRALCDPSRTTQVEHKVKAGIAGFGYEQKRGPNSELEVPELQSINHAIDWLRRLDREHSRQPIIIFDEFDQLEGAQKKVCAELIKQVSDQELSVRFIICGIGTSLDELIGVHLSAGRYISPILLERLTHDARWEIIKSAADQLNVEVGHHHMLRIGQISDGFPSYIHLVAEQVFWEMHDDDQEVEQCTQHHFQNGVRRAVQEAETTLKAIYDTAVQKYSDDYQEVLWALADRNALRRQTTEVYNKSYLRIMEERPEDRHRLTREQFSGKLNSLKTDRHERIIVGMGAGWYEFRENIVRGYVRLRAEEQGVSVGAEGYA